jgi:thioredoxin 2
MTEALHIVCPHCHTTNRVQSADLGRRPIAANAISHFLQGAAGAGCDQL